MPTDPLSKIAIEAQTGREGTVHCFEEIGSTSDEARRLASLGAPTGAVVIAERQTKGRGRSGAVWFSPPGENVTLSMVIRPRLDLARASALSLAIGCSLADALAPLIGAAAPIGLKWPNDLLVGRRKLGGILIEGQLRASGESSLVVGVGINVHTVVFPEGVPATSLAQLGAKTNRNTVAGLVIGAIASASERFEREGFEPFRACFGERDALIGRPVKVGDVVGVARGVSSGGALLIGPADGQLVPAALLRRVASGHVEW